MDGSPPASRDDLRRAVSVVEGSVVGAVALGVLATVILQRRFKQRSRLVRQGNTSGLLKLGVLPSRKRGADGYLGFNVLDAGPVNENRSGPLGFGVLPSRRRGARGYLGFGLLDDRG